MPLIEAQTKVVDDYLAAVKKQIVDATDAVSQGGDPIDAPQLGAILATYARTKPIPVVENAWSQIISVPGIIWIAALLALVFGILSIWVPSLSDIAKVFAGAVVGAAGVGAKR